MNDKNVSVYNPNISSPANSKIVNKSDHKPCCDKNEELLHQNERQQKEIKELMLKLHNADEEIYKIIKENEKLKKDLIELSNTNVILETTKEHYKEDLEIQTELLNDKTNDLDNAQKLIQDKDDYICNLMDEFDFCKTSLNEVVEELANVKKENISKNHEISNLKKQLNKNQNDIAKQQETIQNFTDCIKKRRLENENLVQLLHDLQERLSEANTQLFSMKNSSMNRIKKNIMPVNYMSTEGNDISLNQMSPISKQIVSNLNDVSDSSSKNEINFYSEEKNKTSNKSINDSLLAGDSNPNQDNQTNESSEKSELMVDSGLGIKQNADSQDIIYPNSSSPILNAAAVKKNEISNLEQEYINHIELMDISPVGDNQLVDYDLENDDGGIISRLLCYFKFLVMFAFFFSLITFVYFSFYDKYIIDRIFYFLYNGFEIKAIGDHPLPH